MEAISSDKQIIDNHLIGERRRFVDAWTLRKLGYSSEFLSYANTEWRIIKVTPAWRSIMTVKYYFDLQNDEDMIISSIADEVLIKIN